MSDISITFDSEAPHILERLRGHGLDPNHRIVDVCQLTDSTRSRTRLWDDDGLTNMVVDYWQDQV